MRYESCFTGIYLVCTADTQRGFSAIGMDFIENSKGKALSSLYLGLKKIEYDSKSTDDAVFFKAVQQVIKNVHTRNPGIDSRDMITVVLPGFLKTDYNQVMTEWMLSQKLEVKKVVLVQESRAENLIDRCPAIAAVMEKKFQHKKTDRLRRICYGMLLAVFVDERHYKTEDDDIIPFKLAHSMMIIEMNRDITCFIVEWLYAVLSAAIVSWNEQRVQECTLRGLYNQILRFSFIHAYEDSSGLDGVYLQFFEEYRNLFKGVIWEHVVKTEFECEESISQSLYDVYRKTGAGLLKADRFRELKMSGFIIFVNRQILDKIMYQFGKEMDEQITGEERETMIKWFMDPICQYDVEKKFRFFATCHVEETWRHYLESESFQAEIYEAVQIARDVFFDRAVPAV